MSRAQGVHQDCKFDNQYLYRQSLAQLQSCQTYSAEDSPTNPLVNFQNPVVMMSQSMVVSDAFAGGVLDLTAVKGSHYMQTQPWPLQQVEQDDVKPTATTPSTPSSNIQTYPSGQSWSAGYGAGAFDWPQAIQQAETFIIPNSESQYRQNHALVFDSTPMAQETAGKSFQGGPTTWTSWGLSGLPRGVAPSGSVLGASMSPSPKSYVSDELGNTYSPVAMPDQASPTGDWNGYAVTASNANMSSPSCASLLAQKSDGGVALSGLSRTSTSMRMATLPSHGSGRQDPVPIAPYDDDQLSGSEYSHSQQSSAGHSPWYHANYSYDAANMPFRSRDLATYSNPSSDASNSSTSDARPTQHRSVPWDNSRPVAHPQSRVQDRFQVPRSAVAQAQREHNDQLLIEGKKRGETYKEIKLKMVGEKPAESTLRGRYRSLTKARKDRVRKPVWTRIDLELLDETVQQEFDRIESNLVNPQSLSFDQKILKVAWKKVAEFIADNGGSYHFGNATCKRKWLECHPGCK